MEIRSIPAVQAALRVGRAPDTEPGQAGLAQALPGADAASIAKAITKVGTAETPQDAPAAPHEARYVRDDETNRLVLSVVDPGTGDVIAQLPTKAALRAQAYATDLAARSTARSTVARLA